VGATLGYAFVVTALLAWLVSRTVGSRVTPIVEGAGIDEAEHAESGYELPPLSAAVATRPAGATPASSVPTDKEFTA